jgi:hypothetical protein
MIVSAGHLRIHEMDAFAASWSGFRAALLFSQLVACLLMLKV